MNTEEMNPTESHNANDAAAKNDGGSRHALPPVEPPGPGFIMQLFFVPLIIVAIIVSVWLAFSWLAHMGSRPEELVKDFERLNEGTWQKALTLANLLRDSSNAELRNDSNLARRLADVLHQQIDEAKMDAKHVSYRMYLCRALGEFNTTDGIGTLLTAVATERSPDELPVRRGALQALIRLVEQNGAQPVEAHPEAFAVLSKAGLDHGPENAEERGHLRKEAAYLMGLLPSDAYREQLALMLSDGFAYARYNAASGLARQGDARAIPRLLEMLDPENQALLGNDRERAMEHKWNQQHLLINALRATRQLIESNRQLDARRFRKPVQAIIDSQPEGQLRLEAQDTMRLIRTRESPDLSRDRSRGGDRSDNFYSLLSLGIPGAERMC